MHRLRRETRLGSYLWAAYIFDYCDWNGNSTGFYRAKLITHTGAPTGQKYHQPPKTVPHLYIPRIRPWPKIIKDPTQKIIIAEGEKKAILLCLMGYNAVGIGGIFNFKSKKLQQLLLPEFNDVVWEERETELVFDDDTRQRGDLLPGLDELSMRLYQRGAEVSLVRIPSIGADKTGVDDFVMANGGPIKAKKAYEELPRDATQAIEQIKQIDQQYAYVQSMPDTVVELNTGILMTKRKFLTHVAKYTYSTYTQTGQVIEVNPGAQWLKYPYRREVKSITFEPKPVTEQPAGNHIDKDCYNTWGGWLFGKPEPGDITTYLELKRFLSNGRYDEAFDWLEQLIRYRLENPAEKVPVDIMLTGPEGCGKNLLIMMLGSLFSPHFTPEVDTEKFLARFNKWQEGMLVCGVDELLLVDDKRITASRLKGIVSRTTMAVEPKGVDTYWVPDYNMWFFSTNKRIPLYLESGDRRTLMIACCEGMPIAEARAEGARFYKPVKAFCADSQSLAALAYYLLGLKKNRNFNPSIPPMTEAKDTAIKEGRWSVEKLCHQLIQARDAFRVDELAPGEVAEYYYVPDLASSSNICDKLLATTDERKKKLDHFMVGNAMRELRVPHTRQVRVHGFQERLWILRHPEYWGNPNVPASEIRDYAEHAWTRPRPDTRFNSRDNSLEIRFPDDLSKTWFPLTGKMTKGIDDYFTKPSRIWPVTQQEKEMTDKKRYSGSPGNSRARARSRARKLGITVVSKV